MQYTVTCRKSGLDELAFFWLLAGKKRHAITIASDQIDRSLRQDPYLGVQHGTMYHFSSGPLTAVYQVHPQDLKVEILQFLYHG